jgi:hypothetical protein
MAIVFAQTGVAVDWDWASELTLWSSNADRIGVRLGTHRLLHRPASERQATAQARHWWLAEGRETLTDDVAREAALTKPGTAPRAA